MPTVLVILYMYFGLRHIEVFYMSFSFYPHESNMRVSIKQLSVVVGVVVVGGFGW